MNVVVLVYTIGFCIATQLGTPRYNLNCALLCWFVGYKIDDNFLEIFLVCFFVVVGLLVGVGEDVVVVVAVVVAVSL